MLRHDIGLSLIGGIRNDIYRVHQEYLGRHGGRRAKNPDSTHHSIEEKRLSEWQAKWKILGIFG